VSPFKPSAVYYVEVRWRGFRRFKVSTDTTVKSRAQDMERTLWALRHQGRRDLIGLLAAGRLTLPDLHNAFVCGQLDRLQTLTESPKLGPLVTEWLAWLRSPAGISSRTHRRFAPQTVTRYEVSWSGFFEVLPRGRESSLALLTSGFVADYRAARRRAVGGRKRQTRAKPLAAGTLNRDLAALGAFLTWCGDVRGLKVERPRISREREPRGRERWLSADELAAFKEHCPPKWWPFFAVLFYTGARLGEVQGLRGADVLVAAKRITIHESERRVKTKESVRDLPIPSRLSRRSRCTSPASRWVMATSYSQERSKIHGGSTGLGCDLRVGEDYGGDAPRRTSQLRRSRCAGRRANSAAAEADGTCDRDDDVALHAARSRGIPR
jgi:integrase